jgi:hypothetical protein
MIYINNKSQQVISRLNQLQIVIGEHVSSFRHNLGAFHAAQERVIRNQNDLRNDNRQLRTMREITGRHTKPASAGPKTMEEGASPGSFAQSEAAESVQDDEQVFRDSSSPAGATESSHDEEGDIWHSSSHARAEESSHAKEEAKSECSSTTRAADISGADEEVSSESSAKAEAAGTSQLAAGGLGRYDPKPGKCLEGVFIRWAWGVGTTTSTRRPGWTKVDCKLGFC